MTAATEPQEIDRPEELVDTRLVIWFFLAALAYLFVSMLGGFVMALQLVRWNPFQGVELLSPGRWRMVHTNAVAYGFLANAFLGALHWAVPRLTLKPVLSKSLANFIFIAWQVIVLSTAGRRWVGRVVVRLAEAIGLVSIVLGALAGGLSGYAYGRALRLEFDAVDALPIYGAILGIIVGIAVPAIAFSMLFLMIEIAENSRRTVAFFQHIQTKGEDG